MQEAGVGHSSPRQDFLIMSSWPGLHFGWGIGHVVPSLGPWWRRLIGDDYDITRLISAGEAMRVEGEQPACNLTPLFGPVWVPVHRVNCKTLRQATSQPNFFCLQFHDLQGRQSQPGVFPE